MISMVGYYDDWRWWQQHQNEVDALHEADQWMVEHGYHDNFEEHIIRGEN